MLVMHSLKATFLLAAEAHSENVAIAIVRECSRMK